MAEAFKLNPGNILKWNHNGTWYCIHCELDEDPLNPVEDEEEIQLACWHPRYCLGNCRVEGDMETFWQGLVEAYLPGTEKAGDLSIGECKDLLDDVLTWTNLYLLDHSGLSISAAAENPYIYDRLDSGRVGVAFMRKNEHAMEQIEAFVKVYDQYLSGMVYAMTLLKKKENGHWVDLETIGDGYDDDVYGYFDLEPYGLAEAVASGEYEVKPIKVKTISYFDYDA